MQGPLCEGFKEVGYMCKICSKIYSAMHDAEGWRQARTRPYSAAVTCGSVMKAGRTAASWIFRSFPSSALIAWHSASSRAYATSASPPP